LNMNPWLPFPSVASLLSTGSGITSPIPPAPMPIPTPLIPFASLDLISRRSWSLSRLRLS
jgi:hypothetical protein